MKKQVAKKRDTGKILLKIYHRCMDRMYKEKLNDNSN